MSDKFRWAVLGPGRIADRFAESLVAVDGAEVYAVASRDIERAQSFAHRYNVPNAYQGYEAILDCPEIDAVYIATPISCHFEQCLLFLNAGIPVLCEKSFTINETQAKELCDIALRNNVFLMEAMWTVFLPIYDVVSDWISRGKIGKIKQVQSSFGFSIPRDLKGRELNHKLGGGTLLEFGVYNVAISQWLMKRFPQKIHASGVVGETNVDECIAANLDYGNGEIAQFICSYQSELNNSVVIGGDKGKITIHPYFWDNGRASLKTDGQEITVEKTFRARGFEYQIEHVMACIKDGRYESTVMTHENTLNNLKIMDEIRHQIGFKYEFE